MSIEGHGYCIAVSMVMARVMLLVMAVWWMIVVVVVKGNGESDSESGWGG